MRCRPAERRTAQRLTGDRRRPVRPSRRGGALLETVLVMPLMLMLTFGAVEYGWAFYLKHSIGAAAYAASRAAIATGSTNAQVTAVATASLQAAGLTAANYTVTTSPSTVAGQAAGTYMSVSVSCNWSTVGISPLPQSMGGLPANKQLTCTVLMAHE